MIPSTQATRLRSHEQARTLYNQLFDAKRELNVTMHVEVPHLKTHHNRNQFVKEHMYSRNVISPLHFSPKYT